MHTHQQVMCQSFWKVVRSDEASCTVEFLPQLVERARLNRCTGDVEGCTCDQHAKEDHTYDIAAEEAVGFQEAVAGLVALLRLGRQYDVPQ